MSFFVGRRRRVGNPVGRFDERGGRGQEQTREGKGQVSSGVVKGSGGNDGSSLSSTRENEKRTTTAKDKTRWTSY